MTPIELIDLRLAKYRRLSWRGQLTNDHAQRLDELEQLRAEIVALADDGPEAA